MWGNLKNFWLTGHLLLLTAEDIRERQLSLFLILELGLTGAIRIWRTGGSPALFPGFMMLLAGWLSREQIGYGDGCLVTALGMWMTGEELYRILFCGTVFCLIFSACTGKKELPLVPFLTAGWLAGGWL